MKGEISVEQDNKLYGLSVIPTVVVFAILASYYSFAHLPQLPPGTSLMWDSFLNFLIPMLVLTPETFFAAYEILSRRKNNTMRFHVKRLLGRTALLFIALTVFVVVYLESYFLLAPLISERFAMLGSLLLWLLILGACMARFHHFLAKLEKGEW